MSDVSKLTGLRRLQRAFKGFKELAFLKFERVRGLGRTLRGSWQPGSDKGRMGRRLRINGSPDQGLSASSKGVAVPQREKQVKKQIFAGFSIPFDEVLRL